MVVFIVTENLKRICKQTVKALIRRRVPFFFILNFNLIVLPFISSVMGYKTAINQGADVIECDMTVTKDKHIVCLHEPNLGQTTNVASVPEFADRKNSYNISNELYGVIQYEQINDDWFSVDFTLSELKQLRKVQSDKLRDPSFNGMYEISTLEEMIQLVKTCTRPVGLYLESKQPRWINSLPIMSGTTLEKLAVDVLHRHGYRRKRDPVFLQSFEEESLYRLKELTKLPLVRLIHHPAVDTSDTQLKEWSSSFYGIGVWKPLFFPSSFTLETGYKNKLGEPTDLVRRAHRQGLRVHVFTMRNEDEFLAWDYHQDPVNEYVRFLDMGVDGIFTDSTETMKRVLDARYKCK